MSKYNMLIHLLVIAIPILFAISIFRLSRLRDYNKYQKKRYYRFSYLLVVILLISNLLFYYSKQAGITVIAKENKQAVTKVENTQNDYSQMLMKIDSLRNECSKLLDEKLTISADKDALFSNVLELKSIISKQNFKVRKLEKQIETLELSTSQIEYHDQISPITVKNISVE